jgi:DNA-binding NarL/FixJ family response regulator
VVKVILIDNHALSRIGLKTILANDPRYEVIGDYKYYSLIQQELPSLPVDLFIVNPDVNHESGFEVAQHLKQMHSSYKVVILTDNKEEYHVLNAVQSGIDAYIGRSAEPDEIMLGINKVVNGQKYFSADVSSILVNNAQRRQTRSIPLLTNKEKEVIRLLMEGFSSKQIAARLDVSPRTVHSHRANILGKFNLKNTTQLITKIAEQKIFL